MSDAGANPWKPMTRPARHEVPAHHEVMVLGAGPSGTATAIRLARLGIDVALVEQSEFPRAHVGICIGDQTLALLEFLGLGNEFRAAGFWKRALTAVSWGGTDTRFVEQRGYHVDRALLDRLLLGKARDEGVTVYQPARTERPPLAIEGGWRCDFSVAGSLRRVTCGFLVDAAGRRPALPGARTKDSPPLIALYADWRLRRPARFDGLIESGAHGWAWYAQTRRDRAIVSVFLDPRGTRFDGRSSLQAKYERLLKQFPVLRRGVSGEQCSPPRACNATSSHSTDPVGSRHIRVGDACLSVDPLSSQGVHLALQSGIQSATIVNTILRKPDNADLARQFYDERVSERVGQFTARMRTEYARVAAVSRHAFWRERADEAAVDAPEGPRLRSATLPSDPDLKLALAPDAVIASGPVIAGDFVERRAILNHVNIARPVAFLAGADLPALLAELPFRFAVRDLPQLWRDHVCPAEARSIAHWLWQRRILVEAA